MRKITHYFINTSDLLTVEERMKVLLKNGWQPFGSIATFMAADRETLLVAQPMVRYEEVPE